MTKNILIILLFLAGIATNVAQYQVNKYEIRPDLSKCDDTRQVFQTKEAYDAYWDKTHPPVEQQPESIEPTTALPDLLEQQVVKNQSAQLGNCLWENSRLEKQLLENNCQADQDRIAELSVLLDRAIADKQIFVDKWLELSHNCNLHTTTGPS